MRDDTSEQEPGIREGAAETPPPLVDAVLQAPSPEQEGDASELRVRQDPEQEALVEEPVVMEHVPEECVESDATGGSGVDLAEILASSSEGHEERPCIGAQETLADDESADHTANLPSALTIGRADDPQEASEAATDSVASAEGASPSDDAQTLHFGKVALESGHCEVEKESIELEPIELVPTDTEPTDTGPNNTGPIHTGPVETGPVGAERTELEPKENEVEPTVAPKSNSSEEESDSFVKEVMSELDDSTFLIASDTDTVSSGDGISVSEGMSLAAAALPLWQDLEQEEESSLHELRSLQGRRRQLVDSFLDALREGEVRLGDVQNRLSKARQDSNNAQQRAWQTSQQLQVANDRIQKLEARLTDTGSLGQEVDDLRQAVSDREREVAELAQTSMQLAHDLEAAKSRLAQEQTKARSQLEAVLRRVAELESAAEENTEAARDEERPTTGLSVQEVLAEASEPSAAPFKPTILEGGAAAEPKEGDLALQNLRAELQDLA